MKEVDFYGVLAKTQVYPEATTGSANAIKYCILGLIGEAGELANQFKKVYRDDGGELTQDRHETLVDELGDVYWYLIALSDELGISMAELRERNAAKLLRRKTNGTIHGDRRSESGLAAGERERARVNIERHFRREQCDYEWCTTCKTA